jgi:hypothetical protein
VLNPLAVDSDRATVMTEHLAGVEGRTAMRLLLGRPGEGERAFTNMGQQRVAQVVHAGMRHVPSMPEIVVHNRAGSEKRAAGLFHMVSGMCMFRFRDPDFERAFSREVFGLEWGPDGPKRELDWTSVEAIRGSLGTLGGEVVPVPAEQTRRRLSPLGETNPPGIPGRICLA